MEKFFYLIIVTCIIFTGCGKSLETAESAKKENRRIDSTFVIPQKAALDRAFSLLNALDGIKTKASPRTLSKVDIVYPDNIATKSNENVAPSLYVFNFRDNAGFTIISADKRDSGAVYIASIKGKLDITKIQGTPYEYIMSMIKKYQEVKIHTYKNNIQPNITKSLDDGYTGVTTFNVIESIGPLLQTKWGQGPPFNTYLNNTIYAGYSMCCYSVALAQIAAYYNYPSAYNGTVFNWNYLNTTPTESEANLYPTKGLEVSKFIYTLGIPAGVYYDSASEAGIVNDNNYVLGIQSLGFSCNSLQPYTYSLTNSSLNNRCPVLIRGKETGARYGHAWVIDGYQYIIEEYRTYDENGNPVEDTVIDMNNYDFHRKYLHCNFGWAGSRDGNYQYYYDMICYNEAPDPYIYANIFNTAGASSYDQPLYDNNIYNFDSGLKIICNIMP